jgi:hypothetical protein
MKGSNFRDGGSSGVAIPLRYAHECPTFLNARPSGR